MVVIPRFWLKIKSRNVFSRAISYTVTATFISFAFSATAFTSSGRWKVGTAWYKASLSSSSSPFKYAIFRITSFSASSCTCDRGSEFANWQTIEKALNCDVYFTDPYCAWQKDSNENSTGLLREFYPKRRNLSRVSPKTLLRNLALINARPRKVLNFHSAQDLWNQELDNLLRFTWPFTILSTCYLCYYV